MTELFADAYHIGIGQETEGRHGVTKGGGAVRTDVVFTWRLPCFRT